MQKKTSRKGLVFTVILLFLSVGIKPAIANDISYDFDNSELGEIVIQFYESDKTYIHKVMLTQEQLIELENVIYDFKNQLRSVDDTVDTETIYKNVIVSLEELGLFPDDISIDYAQRIVTGKEQNIMIIKALEKLYNNKHKAIEENENLFCLISGETTNTFFTGIVPFSIHLHCILFSSRYFRFYFLLKDYNYELWKWWASIFDEISIRLVAFRMIIWYIIAGILNLFPLKIGTIIHYGGYGGNYRVPQEVPAEGWICTNGLLGKKNWSGSFYGNVNGFTGIKIIKGFFDRYYIGSALRIRIENSSLV
jgi:hypothetical protein